MGDPSRAGDSLDGFRPRGRIELRRKAGIKPGDRVGFSVSGRVINITPKLSPDELQDEREISDPKIRAIIRQGYQEFLAGKTRPIDEFFTQRAARSVKRTRKRPGA